MVMVKLSKSSNGERKAEKRGEFFLKIKIKRTQRTNTSKQHKMKKKKAQGPFYSQNLGFKGRKGNHWKMTLVQIGYHEPDPPLWVIAYWASISRMFLKSFEQKFLKKS
jgi:hypothetical protein